MNNRLVQHDLLDIKEELEFIWENTSDAIFVLNEHGAIIKANPFVEKLFGWSEVELLTEQIPPFIPDKSLISQRNFIERIKSERTIKDVYRMRTKRNGEQIEVLASYELVTYKDRNVIVATYKDVSDLKESEQRFKSLFMNNPDGIWSIDLDGIINSVNPALEKQLGFKEEEIVGSHYSEMNVWKDENDFQKNAEHLNATLSGQTQEYEITLTKKDTQEVQLVVKTIPITVRGKIVGLYGINKDITKQKQLEKELERLAYTDSLTGLPNRRAVTNLIEESLNNSKKIGLLFLDIDDFKQINDKLGHDAGDQLLIQFTDRVENIVLTCGLFGRLSGDEFVVIIQNLEKREQAVELAKKILHVLIQPFHLSGKEVHISSSIGIAYSPEHGKNKTTLLKSADNALYRAKEQGKNTLYVFQS
ncbi:MULTISPECIES: diguanylate cyclase domain-containing protein [Bacillus]|uniref:diguanylate cyclase domain-containing protein n=1 Tax=Bacillus TaxID=1386 RepID=UPI000BB6DB13|nr:MULTISPECIES: diguanylate cyclase [Bacillus]